jgi:hypothetical protein
MKNKESFKPFVISLAIAAGSLIVFYLSIGMCFFGCSGNQGSSLFLMALSGSLLFISVISLFICACKILVTPLKDSNSDTDNQDDLWLK